MRELLQAGGSTIRWDRGLLLFAALVVAGLLRVALSFASSQSAVMWSAWSGAALRMLCSEALLVLAVVLAYRLVRSPLIAAACAGLAYGLAQAAIEWIAMPGRVNPELRPVLALSRLVGAAAWLAALLIVVELLLPRMRHQWMSVPIAWIAAYFAALLAGIATAPLAGGSVDMARNILKLGPGVLAEAVLFTATLYAALRLAGPIESAARMDRSKYIGLLLALLGIPALLFLARAILVAGRAWTVDRFNQTDVMVLHGIASAFIVAGAVVFMVFVYRMWNAIRGPHARMTPGKALGLLFVPIFNLYWMFQVFAGFAKDFNRLVAERAYAVPLLPVGLFIAYPIAAFMPAIPILGAFLLPVSCTIGLVMVAKTCTAVNALPRDATPEGITAGAASAPA